MDRERYRPAVAVWNYSDQDLHVPLIRALDVPLYSFPGNRATKLHAFRGLVRQLQPEVVHSWSFYTNFAAYWAAIATRAVSLGSVRSDFLWAVKECGSVVGNLSARWPNIQICNSSSAAEHIHAVKKYFVPSQVSVVRNAIDLDCFPSFPIPSEEPIRILGIGYLLPVKRWDRLLLAVEQLKKRGITCLAQIAGDGPLRPDLEQLAVDRGISDRVQFFGHVDDIPGLLAKAAFVVHTAESEGCPNSVMEAMACGRAVVATDAGDIPFLIEDGKTGFIAPRNHNSALVECMERLITDRDLVRRMGEAGRAKAQAQFGLQLLVGQTFNAYQAAGWNGN
jgi:glycosyltransferase involved in cell wall biosynthesis